MPQIILDKPHTHAGVLRAIGTELKVLEHEAYYLVKRDIAHLKGGVTSRPASPPPLPDSPQPRHVATPARDTTDPADTGAIS